jgi:hypothetical protein
MAFDNPEKAQTLVQYAGRDGVRRDPNQIDGLTRVHRRRECKLKFKGLN